eukprot:COSAG03_NODE_14_length_22296_cov_10.813128_10_plen_90_part_00
MGGGESHQSGVPSQLVVNLADPAELCDTKVETRRMAMCSRADDGSIGPSALSASEVVPESTSAQQTVASCRSQRALAVPATTERRPMHA